MKLFVFEGVLADYTDGIAFALARNVVEAKLKIYEKSLDERYISDDPKPKKYYITQFKKFLTGKMSRQEWERLTGTKYDSVAVAIMDEEPTIVSKAEGFYIWGGG
jgi:hypothetical protein